jgi:shikimate kinase
MDTYLSRLKEVNYVISGKNKIYNFEEWKDNKQPVLFIVGLSGSGKSTIGKELATKYKAEYVSLDKISNKYQTDLKKKYNEKSYTPKINKMVYEYMDKFIKQLEKKKTKVVAEGVQIAYYPDLSYFKNKPLIILGASVIISSLRGFIRDRKRFGSDESMIETISYILASQVEFVKKLRALENAVK